MKKKISIEMMMRSQKLLAALWMAARITEKTGKKPSLRVWWNNRIKAGSFHGDDGLADRLESKYPDLFDPEENLLNLEKDFIEICFQPNTEVTLPTAELEDLQMRGRESPKMISMGIGRVDEKGDIQILFVNTPPTDEALLRIEKAYSAIVPSSQKDILPLLKEQGIKCQLWQLRRKTTPESVMARKLS